jgi:hypothetical protein
VDPIEIRGSVDLLDPVLLRSMPPGTALNTVEGRFIDGLHPAKCVVTRNNDDVKNRNHNATRNAETCSVSPRLELYASAPLCWTIHVINTPAPFRVNDTRALAAATRVELSCVKDSLFREMSELLTSQTNKRLICRVVNWG